MKLRIFFLTAFLVLLLNACNNEEPVISGITEPLSTPKALSLDEVSSLNSKQGKELSENDVLKIAEDYVKDITKQSKNFSAKTRAAVNSSSFSISSKYYLGQTQTTRSNKESGVKSLVYEINIDNGDDTVGRIIVSGDDRYPVVIAYIPYYRNNNKPSCNLSCDTDFMLRLSKAVYADNLNKIVSNQKEKENTIKKIANGLSINYKNVDDKAINDYVEKYGVEKNPVEADLVNSNTRTEPSSPMEEPGSKLIRSYGKPCGTTWDQWIPYNNDYPIDWVALAEGNNPICSKDHHPAGCAVVAIAQILAALEPNGMVCNGININWKYLKEKKVVNGGPFGTIDPSDKIEMVSALFKDIYDETNSYPQWGKGTTDEWPPQEVNCVLQTGTTSSNVFKYFSSNSGVTAINANLSGMSKWDPEIIRKSLQYSFPVFVGGSNHAFVLDEFLYCVKKLSTYELIKTYDVYFHANFGWGEGTGNGYYLVKDTQNGTITFHTGNGDFKDSDLQIIPYIGNKTL